MAALEIGENKTFTPGIVIIEYEILLFKCFEKYILMLNTFCIFWRLQVKSCCLFRCLQIKSAFVTPSMPINLCVRETALVIQLSKYFANFCARHIIFIN